MTDVYRIGVTIALTNSMSSVLAIISKDLLGINASIGTIAKGFASWKPALIGASELLAGAAILGTMTKLAEKAADFQDAMTKVSQLNPKVAALVQSGEIQKLSFSVGQQLGMNVEDVTKVYGGIYGVLQDPAEAEELTPMAARYARLMQLRHPGSHPEESINTLMRAGELSGRLTDDKGAIDPQRVQEWFDLAARLEAATHGQVNADSLLALGQQGGGVALRGLSQEGFEHMAIVSQMMGGARAGTALLSLRSQLGGGAMMKRSAQAMQEYGLLQDGEWTSEGGHVQMNDEAANRLGGLVSSDPMAFVDELVKRLEAHGVTDRDKQMVAIQRILGRQTTQRMVSDMLLAREQIRRETGGLEQGASVSQGLAGYDQNFNANLQAFDAAWHNLMVAVGGPAIQAALPGMKAAADLFNSLGTFAQANPGTIKIVAEGITALGFALLGVGTATLIALGGLPAIITGIVAGGAALIALNWSGLTSMFTGITSAISSFIDAIAALYHRITGYLDSRPQQVFPGGTQKQSFEGDPHKLFTPTMFDPGARQQPAQQASFSLNVDGRSLAQSVIDHLESLYGSPTSASAADGMASPFGDQYVST
jgi:hypothetical protein